MSNARIFLSLFLTGMILILGVACSSVAEKVIEKPRVQLSSVGLKDVGVQAATLVFSVDVENPNPFRLRVDSLKYEVEVSGKNLSSGSLEQVTEVRGNEKTTVNIPVVVQYSDVFTSMLDFLRDGTTNYRVKGSAKFGPMVIPFDETGKIDLKSKQEKK